MELNLKVLVHTLRNVSDGKLTSKTLVPLLSRFCTFHATRESLQMNLRNNRLLYEGGLN